MKDIWWNHITKKHIKTLIKYLESSQVHGWALHGAREILKPGTFQRLDSGSTYFEPFSLTIHTLPGLGAKRHMVFILQYTGLSFLMVAGWAGTCRMLPRWTGERQIARVTWSSAADYIWMTVDYHHSGDNKQGRAFSRCTKSSYLHFFKYPFGGCVKHGLEEAKTGYTKIN